MAFSTLPRPRAVGAVSEGREEQMADGQALAHPAAPAHPVEKEADRVPRSGLPPSPKAVLLGEPRR